MSRPKTWWLWRRNTLVVGTHKARRPLASHPKTASTHVAWVSGSTWTSRNHLTNHLRRRAKMIALLPPAKTRPPPPTRIRTGPGPGGEREAAGGEISMNGRRHPSHRYHRPVLIIDSLPSHQITKASNSPLATFARLSRAPQIQK